MPKSLPLSRSSNLYFEVVGVGYLVNHASYEWLPFWVFVETVPLAIPIRESDILR